MDSSRMPSRSLARFFPGDSEMAGRMRGLDWSSIPLGPPDAWPREMQAAVRLCVTSGIPVVLYLGPELSMLYNDAYIPFLGETKHPRDLARPARECWSEIWDTIGPMMDSVRATRRATLPSDLQMFFRRRLPREEVFVRFTFGPIFSDDGRSVIGIFCPCTDTTEQVVGARRLETLRRMGIRSLEARTVDAACAEAIAVLGENPEDVPFAALYAMDSAGGEATLRAKVGRGSDPRLPESVSVDDTDSGSAWPLAEVLRTRRSAECADLVAAGVRIPGAWSDPTQQAVLFPIEATRDRLDAILVLGVSARRPLDAAYRTFLDLVASHVATAISDARAHEAERERGQKLAEIDRAKTALFSDVSHEFRTPLTLMLAPLDVERAGLELQGRCEPLDEPIDVRQAERRASEDRYRQLVEQLSDALLLAAGDGRCLDVNPAACELFGMSREELLASSLLDMLAPHELRRLRETFTGFGDLVHRGEWCFCRKDGSTFIGELAGRRLPDGRLQAIVRDITERKDVERRILHYQGRLRSMAFDSALQEDRERRRIASNLHDGVGQTLTLAQFRMADACASTDGRLRAVDDCRSLIEQAIDEIRNVTFDLSPPVLYDLGLWPALQWLAEHMVKRYGLVVEIEGDGATDVDIDVSVVLFRGIRELLTNVWKHAKVRTCNVALVQAQHLLNVRVQDQGVGFDTKEKMWAPEAFGLFSIREQIERLGGTVYVLSTPGLGTRVSMVVPYRRASNPASPAERSVPS